MKKKIIIAIDSGSGAINYHQLKMMVWAAA